MNRRTEVTLRYGVAVISVAAGLAMRYPLAGVLGSTVPYVTLFPAVMFAAWFGGLGPGLVATALSLISAYYFVYFSFPGVSRVPLAEGVGGVIFLGVSIFISALNEALRRSRARSDERFQEIVAETARRSRVEQALAESKREAEQARDQFQTTLSSIGDAVIATDSEGNVTFLNAVAQKLTGWSQAEAAGKHVSKVFVIRNETTHAEVESPVERAIRDGVIVGLANHTVLISKDGTHVPIEDSAAPIRNDVRNVFGVVLVFRDVTERRKAEDAVARSEERLKLALHAGRIGVWDWDVVQNRVEWSDLVYDIHGVERGTFAGHVEDFACLVHPDDRERVNNAIADTLRHGTPYDVEFRVVHPGGEVHWVSTTALVFQDEKGDPLRMLGATTDITPRKQAEAQLLQQWRTFDTALSHSPDFTYTFDREGRFTYVNRALLSLWQLPLEEALGKNFFDLHYPPDLASQLQRQIQEVIDAKEPIRDSTPFTGPTGETRYYEYIFVPVFAADGSVEAVAGSTRDITDRNIAEEALRKSEERLTLALEAGGGTGTWDWDIPRDRVYANPQFASLFSLEPEIAITGAPLAVFVAHIHPEDRNRVGEKIREAVANAGDFAEEYRVIQRDASVRWVFARGRCHVDDRGRPSRLPGVAFDITERKRGEEELKRSNEDLTRANRELEEFAYVASHDLQEPLRMVNIYTHLILRHVGGEDAKLSQYADFVQQGVTRMEALLHDLLTFSRTVHTEQLPVGTANLSTAFSDALAVLKNRIEESGAIIQTQSLPAVRGDTGQMAHVFQNLLSNALKYRKSGVPPEIAVSVEHNDTHCVVSVKDNGIGFEQRYADRIFGLFKRLHKDEYPGTGLGLAICKRIVERYGGSMWAEGQPGEGATFRFSLAQAEAEEAEEET